MYELKNVTKIYSNKKNIKKALDNVTLNFEDKGLYFITGKSGCGKTTLLNLLGGLDTASSGTIKCSKTEIESDVFRQDVVSYVFQDFNLINDFSLEENIKVVGNDDEKYISELLTFLDLYDKKNTKVKYLSGGEKQRLAIGRAIAKKFDIILLDEPTGNLDSKNAKIIFDLLKKISLYKLIIVVSHDTESAENYGDYIIKMIDGKVESISDNRLDIKVEFINENNINNEILEIYEKVPKSVEAVIRVEYNGFTETLNTDKNNFLSKIQEVLKKIPKETKVCLYLPKEHNIEKIDIITNHETSNFFNTKFQLKYAFSLLVTSKVKLFISILLITLSLVIASLSLNVANYNVSQALENGIENSNIFSFPIENNIYNEPTDENITHNKGEALYNSLNESFPNKVISVFEINSLSSNNLLVNKALLNVVNDDTFNEKFDSIVLENNEIIVTDFFISYYYPDSNVGDAINLKISNTKTPIQLTIKEILETNYIEEDIFTKIYDDKYVYQNVDSLLQQYLSIYTTSDVYNNCIYDNTLILNASNFTQANNDYATYTNNYFSLSYSLYKSNNIIYGNAPQAKNEVVISNDFYNDTFDCSYTELINSEYEYKDLKESINYNKYLSTMNLYDITDKIKIVGICDSDNDILVSSEFMEELTELSLVYNCSYLSLVDPTIELINYANNNNILFTSNFLAPAYAIKSLLESSLKFVLYILIFILILIASLVLYFFCNILIKSKTKEMAILKSLGINETKMFKAFLFHNIFLDIISLLLSFILSLSILQFVNFTLGQNDVFNINYNLFSMPFMNFVLIILFVAIITLLGTILPLIKIRKINIAELLKNN